MPPTPAPATAVRHASWPRNAIDAFILARLEAAGLQPSEPADRATLIRRLSLDLIGLPPTPEEVEAFVQDQSPDAYEKLVDRLLASPHYGERWARRWLDLARYADTNGYEKDRTRSIWPYRDWVIQALNADMPFDRFTVEQLAGDLLPGATTSQQIATGFHRNTMLNEEGGIDPLEFRFYAMTDRVATTATVWLGLTLGCAQCHTHKFDPIPHREYYQFMASAQQRRRAGDDRRSAGSRSSPPGDRGEDRRPGRRSAESIPSSRKDKQRRPADRRRTSEGESGETVPGLGRASGGRDGALDRTQADRGNRESAAADRAGRRVDLRQRRPEQERSLHAAILHRARSASPRSGSRPSPTIGCPKAGRAESTTKDQPATSS